MIFNSSHPLSFSAFFAAIFFLIFSCTLNANSLEQKLNWIPCWILCWILCWMLCWMLCWIHLDAIITMSPPVCFLAPFVTVARLNQEIKLHPQRGQRYVCYLSAACTFVVFQVWHVNMAEPADVICILIDTSNVGTSFSCSPVFSDFPFFLQKFLNLFLCAVFGHFLKEIIPSQMEV